MTSLPSTKEPNGLLTADNKHPDGLTLGAAVNHWHGMSLSSAQWLSYLHISRDTPGAAAELAASRKIDKYASLPNSFLFEPVAFKPLGTMNSSAISFISDIGRKTSVKSNDDRETAYMLWAVSNS